MITILAPSKTMDVTPMDSETSPTSPLFIDQAREIAAAVATTADMKNLMQVSATIADRVTEMYAEWGRYVKPAYSMYRGDVYKGFYQSTLTDADLKWSQEHLVIMSGLYGTLRPLDAISEYRLEMKAKLSIGEAKNLYHYWGTTLAEYIDGRNPGEICVLSSDEYARPITRYSTSNIITPIFADHKPNGTVGPVPIYSKMMRGVMARWIIDNRVDTATGLRDFEAHGYRYDADVSTDQHPTFVRDSMTPLIFNH